MNRRTVVEFWCNDSRLVGILHQPVYPAKRGVLVVVGGPQYRVGSHRQFVLLSRVLVHLGVAVFRFDHRGIGDSDGTTTFDNLDDDIRAAIDTMMDNVPSVSEIVIWGLCDAASAAMMYAHSDQRVVGLVMLNPWVRSETTLARSYLQQYYLRHVFDRDFWRRALNREVDVQSAIRSFIANVWTAFHRNRRLDETGVPEEPTVASFQQRMEEGLRCFGGRVLFILSGEDITANEFRSLVRGSRAWRRLMARKSVSQHIIPAANHTFSRQEWRDKVAELTAEWLETP